MKRVGDALVAWVLYKYHSYFTNDVGDKAWKCTNGLHKIPREE